MQGGREGLPVDLLGLRKIRQTGHARRQGCHSIGYIMFTPVGSLSHIAADRIAPEKRIMLNGVDIEKHLPLSICWNRQMRTGLDGRLFDPGSLLEAIDVAR
jgi:hypothetical protein